MTAPKNTKSSSKNTRDADVNMKYHANEVWVRTEGGNVNIGRSYKLLDAFYTIRDLSISSGEDPEGRQRAKLNRQFNDSRGCWIYSVGRHGTDTVANWWKNAVASDKNTFNHDPGKLNFAFKMDIQLYLTGGELGNKRLMVYFDDVYIAQGHAGTSNNWWFGGPHCKQHSLSDTVICKGRTIEFGEVSMDVTRGNMNPVDHYDFRSLTFIALEKWMSKIDSNKRLCDIVMPGSHDAGMSTTSHCYPPLVPNPSDVAKTQQHDIYNQLKLGSRYLDIRVDYDHDELVTYHREGAMGCNGQGLKSVMDQIARFLQEQNSEFVIVKFSHIRDYHPDHIPSDIKNRINNLLQNYSNLMLKGQPNDVNLNLLTLGQLRGKLLPVFDYDLHISAAAGLFRYGHHLPVYDAYSNTNNFNTMKNDQLQKLNNYGGNINQLFLLSWTLTASFNQKTETLAKTANGQLPHTLSDLTKKPNIVYVDFLDTGIGTSIVFMNFHGSTLADDELSPNTHYYKP